MSAIDLNADVGEGLASDAELIPLLTSANVACGAHAGDESSMLTAVEAARAAAVTVGAHPGHADREHFGRRRIDLTPAATVELVVSQVQRLQAIAGSAGLTVAYVKPHGALYHQLAVDRAMASAVTERIADECGDLAIVGPHGSEWLAAASESGLDPVAEGYADRAYLADGSLASRGRAGAILDQPADAARQAAALARGEPVPTLDGARWSAPCRTLCVHGDTAGAPAIAAAVRAALEASGFRLQAFAG